MAACVGSVRWQGRQKEFERMKRAWGKSRAHEDSSVVGQMKEIFIKH